MTNNEFREVCRNASYVLNISDPNALCDGGDVYIDGIKVGVVYDELLDDGILSYVDLGFVESASKESIFEKMMSLNLELDASLGEAICFESDSSHLVLRGFTSLNKSDDITAAIVSQLKEYVDFAGHLHHGLLSQVIAPTPKAVMP